MLKRLLYRLYERQLLTEISGGPLPLHIGLIQDGHRRYSHDAGLATMSHGYRIGGEKTEEVLIVVCRAGHPDRDLVGALDR